MRQMPQQEGRPGLIGCELCIVWTKPSQKDSRSLGVCKENHESWAEQTRASVRTQTWNTGMNH